MRRKGEQAAAGGGEEERWCGGEEERSVSGGSDDEGHVGRASRWRQEEAELLTNIMRPSHDLQQ